METKVALDAHARRKSNEPRPINRAGIEAEGWVGVRFAPTSPLGERIEASPARADKSSSGWRQTPGRVWSVVSAPVASSQTFFLQQRFCTNCRDACRRRFFPALPSKKQ